MGPNDVLLAQFFISVFSIALGKAAPTSYTSFVPFGASAGPSTE